MLFVMLSILFNSLASILAKQAALTSIGEGLSGMVINIWFGGEVVLLVCSSITWALALRRLPLSFAYPFLSLVFGINLFSARFIFQEAVEWQHLLGIAVIICGVWVMSSAGHDQGGASD